MKKIYVTVLLGFLSMFVSSQSFSYFYDGNDLYADCQQEFNVKCHYSVIAHIDSHSVMLTRFFCLPENGTAGQYKDIVSVWMKNHPQYRNLPFADIVWMALFEAFTPEIVWQTEYDFDGGEVSGGEYTYYAVPENGGPRVRCPGEEGSADSFNIGSALFGTPTPFLKKYEDMASKAMGFGW